MHFLSLNSSPESVALKLPELLVGALGALFASGPRAGERYAPPAGVGLCFCCDDASPTASQHRKAGAPTAGSDLRSFHRHYVPASGLSSGCGSRHDALPLVRDRCLRLRRGRAVLLTHYDIHLAPGPCSHSQLAAPAVPGPQSRSVYAPDARPKVLSFCHAPAPCGRPWAPGSRFHTTTPSSECWNNCDSLRPTVSSDPGVHAGSESGAGRVG